MQALKVLILASTAVLLLASATSASAHGPGHGRQIAHAHDRYVLRYRHAPAPRWLREHRDFLHWYALNHLRFHVGVSWPSLFRYYQRDHAYHRHYARKPHFKKRHHKHFERKAHRKRHRRFRRHD